VLAPHAKEEPTENMPLSVKGRKGKRKLNGNQKNLEEQADPDEVILPGKNPTTQEVPSNEELSNTSPPTLPSDSSSIASMRSSDTESDEKSDESSYTSVITLSKGGKMSVTLRHENNLHLVKFARSTNSHDVARALLKCCGVTKDNEDKISVLYEISEQGEKKLIPAMTKMMETIKTVKTTPFMGNINVTLVTHSINPSKMEVTDPNTQASALDSVIPRPTKKRRTSDEILQDENSFPRAVLPNPNSNSTSNSTSTSLSTSNSNSNTETKILEKTPYPIGVVGLANLKNTCFANSVLQSLSNCLTFREFLFNKMNLPESVSGDFVSNQMMKLLKQMWSGKHELLSPSSLISALQLKVDLEIGVEEDAHWFLQVLLQIMDEELLNIFLTNLTVSEIFETKRRREFFCKKCKQVSADSDSKNMINTLPLPNIPQVNERKPPSCTLEDCLHLWSDDSKIGYCTFCNNIEENSTNNRYVITQLPQILCLHFNRYCWTGKVINRATRSGAKAKINTRVGFPVKLDMFKYLGFQVDKNEKQYSLYSLAAVLVHDGLTPATGHYYAFCYNSVMDQWFKFDDDRKPVPVTESQVLRANPFMVFYQPTKNRPPTKPTSSPVIPKMQKGSMFLDEVL